MKHPSFRSALPAMAVACFFVAAQARAQLPKIFVASIGNDANDGSRGSPKRNFQAAHDGLIAGGQIIVLDTAGYGALNVTKSLTITVPLGVNGFVTVAGSANGITINASNSDVVSLRGLIVEGGSAIGGNGVRANSVGALTVQDCTVRNFYEGVFLNPTSNAQLVVYNTDVRNCTYGLDVETQGATASTASVNGCRLEGNFYGLYAQPVNGGSVDVSLADCVITGNTFAGLASSALAVVRVNNCNITGNPNGAVTASSGQMLSRGNNTLEHNTNNNTFPGTYSAK